jgi:hypothetical protein
MCSVVNVPLPRSTRGGIAAKVVDGDYIVSTAIIVARDTKGLFVSAFSGFPKAKAGNLKQRGSFETGFCQSRSSV